MRTRLVVTWLCSLGFSRPAAHVAGQAAELDPKLVGTRFASFVSMLLNVDEHPLPEGVAAELRPLAN